MKKLDELLKACIARSVRKSDNRICVWASGGIDSSVLLYYLREYDPVAVHIHFEGEDKALELVKGVTKYLGLELEVYEMMLSDHFDLLDEAVKVHNWKMVAFPTMTLYAARKSMRFYSIYYGLGLDECFAGYPSHFFATDFKKVENYHIARLPVLVERHELQARNLGLRIVAPFVDSNLIEYCRKLPKSNKIQGDLTKLGLRSLMVDKIPEANRLNGLQVGTKGGFHPPINLWWKNGLGNRVNNGLTLKEKIRTRRNRWAKIKLYNEKRARRTADR